jgi:hypothetical protein
VYCPEHGRGLLVAGLISRASCQGAKLRLRGQNAFFVKTKKLNERILSFILFFIIRSASPSLNLFFPAASSSPHYQKADRRIRFKI